MRLMGHRREETFLRYVTYGPRRIREDESTASEDRRRRLEPTSSGPGRQQP